MDAFLSAAPLLVAMALFILLLGCLAIGAVFALLATLRRDLRLFLWAVYLLILSPAFTAASAWRVLTCERTGGCAFPFEVIDSVGYALAVVLLVVLLRKVIRVGGRNL